MNGRAGWGFAGLVAVLVVLHFVLRVGLGYQQLAPDLLVVAVLLAARQLPAGIAAGAGFFMGLLEGALVPTVLGASALALTIVAFLGARSREVFTEDNYILLALYLFAGKWAYDVILFIATGDVFGVRASYLFLISPLTALYAAAAGLVSVTIYRALT
jgi:rod shape-determining protein MreD